MNHKKLKTKAWPNGREWPDEIVLDVGSNMPMDVYGMADNAAGVRYVRHDVAAPQWQPIESAPKNGTRILLHVPAGIRVGYYSSGFHWVTAPGAYGCTPTHWMPLPEPPKD